MEKDPSPIEIIKVAFNSNPNKIDNGLIPIDLLTKDFRMTFKKITRKADPYESKSNKNRQRKGKAHLRLRFWRVKKWKWMDKMWKNLFLMPWIRTSIQTNLEKMKKNTKATIHKTVENRTEATPQGTAKGSRTHFHKNSSNSKNNRKWIRNFQNLR